MAEVEHRLEHLDEADEVLQIGVGSVQARLELCQMAASELLGVAVQVVSEMESHFLRL